MSNLINFNNVITMSSLEIAELTDKQHKHVLHDIRKMLTEIDSAEKTAQYKDSTGRTLPMLLLDKDETLCLVAGYNTKLRMKIIKRWQELENGATPQQPSNGLPEYRKAKATKMMMDTVSEIYALLPNLGEQSKQTILASMINPIAGDVIPLPILEEKTYTATEVGNMLGVSSKKIGSIANKLEMKNSEYGIFVLDKSAYSNKQVESFRYNDKAVLRIERELQGVING